MESSIPETTVLIPVYNEEWAIYPLYGKLCQAMEEAGERWELLFVNDGSTDKTSENLEQLASGDNQVRVIHLRRNYGLTQTLQAGFDHAAGKYVVTISGNLQNEPSDIPKLLKKMREGYDVCAGWRKSQDGQLYRVRPKKLLNWLISRVSGIPLHDYECTMRAYRTRTVRGLQLSGTLDRYIPVYVGWQGGRIAELEVKQLPRSHGHGTTESPTKRTLKTLLDLVFLKFLQKYSTKPLYVFGSLGAASILSSICAFGFMIYYKLSGGPTFIETPLPLLTALFFLTGVMLVVLGIMTEFLTRIYRFNARTEFYDVVDSPDQL